MNLTALVIACFTVVTLSAGAEEPPGMVWIPGGEFAMGTDEKNPEFKAPWNQIRNMKEANWLPAPKGPFFMAMRLYWPKEEALQGKWTAPLLKRVD